MGVKTPLCARGHRVDVKQTCRIWNCTCPWEVARTTVHPPHSWYGKGDPRGSIRASVCGKRSTPTAPVRRSHAARRRNLDRPAVAGRQVHAHIGPAEPNRCADRADPTETSKLPESAATIVSAGPPRSMSTVAGAEWWLAHRTELMRKGM